MITSKLGTLMMTIKELPVPSKYIMVTIERDFGRHKSNHEYFFTREEFVQFFEPLREYMMEIENDVSDSIQG